MSDTNMLDGSYKWIVLLITTVGSFVTPLDGSIVSIALPSIASDLDINFTTVIWIPTTYLLLLSVFLLIFGRLADTKGRRTLFISGFAVFTVASGFCAVSRSGVELIVFRAVQGSSAAMIGATSPAIVTDVFPNRERGKALGINATAVYTGLSVGPSLGGFLVQNLGWRWIFLINIPIGIFIVALSLLRLEESMNLERSRKFDFLGGCAFSFGLSALLLALTLGPGRVPSQYSTALFAISGIAFILFVLVENKMGHDALFDISLFTHNRLFASANASALLNYTSFFGVTFLMSFYLQRVLNFSPAQAGLILLSMPIVMAVFSPISGWLSDKFGTRLLSSAGMMLISLGLFMFATISVHSTGFDIVARLLLIGFGMGVFSSPNTSAVMGSVERHRLSVAAGTLATMRFVGQSMSLALMGAVASSAVSQEIISDLITGSGGIDGMMITSAFVEGIRRAFLISGLIAVAGVFTSLIRGKGK